MTMKVWTNGEEAYVAESPEAVIAFMLSPEGGSVHPDDISPVDEWREQTGEIAVTWEEKFEGDDLRGLISVEPTKYAGQIRVVKSAETWASTYSKPGLLWTSNY